MNTSLSLQQAADHIEQAKAIYKALAADNNETAYINLAGVTSDKHEAEQYYQKAIDIGSSTACYLLAELKNHSYDCCSPHDDVIKLYKSAAMKGHIDSIQELAFIGDVMKDTQQLYYEEREYSGDDIMELAESSMIKAVKINPSLEMFEKLASVYSAIQKNIESQKWSSMPLEEGIKLLQNM